MLVGSPTGDECVKFLYVCIALGVFAKCFCQFEYVLRVRVTSLIFLCVAGFIRHDAMLSPEEKEVKVDLAGKVANCWGNAEPIIVALQLYLQCRHVIDSKPNFRRPRPFAQHFNKGEASDFAVARFS